MLLEDKVALIHAAGGQIGRRTAEWFAREGAQVWLAGRDAQKLEPLAEGLRKSGRNARTITIDALDSASIEEGTAQVARPRLGILRERRKTALGPWHSKLMVLVDDLLRR